MQRRTFIKTAAFGAASIAVGGGIAWSIVPSNEKNLRIGDSIKLLDMIQRNPPTMTGDWDLYKVLIHCAQSVDYSIDGYPEHKSLWFKSTLGRSAFKVFQSKGKMHHPLNEAIPGAPLIIKPPHSHSIEEAAETLRASLLRFERHSGSLQEHFAYGRLSKNEYEKAHTMHLNNHMLEMMFS